jgi:hypothetical protein
LGIAVGWFNYSSKLPPESFFKQRPQHSIREHSHRSKGKQTIERLRILQKNDMRIHYLQCQKNENHQMRVTTWRLTTMDEKFSDMMFATADQAVGYC